MGGCGSGTVELVTARRIGGAKFRGHLRLEPAWLCVVALLATLCAAGLGLRYAYAQATQSTQPAQAPSSQKTGSQPAAKADATSARQSDVDDAQSNSGPDSADDLLKEFPADSQAKADNDPRDGHFTSEPAAKPLPPEELNPQQPVTGKSAQSAVASSVQTAKPALARPATTEPAQTAAAPPPPVKLPTDPRQRKVAIECSDLLKMATDLKAAVDKSTKDELSVDVVRKAGELEQYARKLRTGTSLTAGKE